MQSARDTYVARWSPLSGHLQPLAYAALLRASDEPDVGRERLDDAEAQLRSEDLVCAYCGMAFRVAAAISAAQAAQLERAEAFVSAAEASAALWKAGPWPAALEEARGELARARGDEQDARARLGAAHEAFARAARAFDAERVARRLAALR